MKKIKQIEGQISFTELTTKLGIKETISRYKKEVKIRTSNEAKDEDILLDLMTHDKISFEEFRKYVFDNNLDVVLAVNKEQTNEFNWGNHVSCLSQYSRESYFDVLPTKDFPFEDIKRCWCDNPTELEVLEAESRSYKMNDYTVALQYNEYNPAITIYNKNKMIAFYEINTSSSDCVNRVIFDEIESYTENIKSLCEYDKLDLQIMIKCYEMLCLNYKNYILKEKQSNYKKAKGVWNKKIGSNFRIKFDEVYDEWGNVVDKEKYMKAYETKGWGKKTTFGDKDQYYSWKEYTKAEKEANERTYQQSYKSYSNSYNSSYSYSSKPSYTDEEREYLKSIYKAAAMKLHPDIKKDNGEAMKFLNKLKETWNI